MGRQEEFINAVSYHKVGPEDKDVVLTFKYLREAAADFGVAILTHTEASREQSLALTHVEEALMWATKQVAITRLPVAE